MPIARVTDSDKARLDEAARAGWLYFIAGHTQDEIAKRLKVSRATAQRLVSLCLSERLITFRLEHPIAACMDLAKRLIDKFELRTCEVAPTVPGSPTAVGDPGTVGATSQVRSSNLSISRLARSMHAAMGCSSRKVIKRSDRQSETRRWAVARDTFSRLAISSCV